LYFEIGARVNNKNMEITAHEITDLVYDTLMGNSHEQLDLNEVQQPEVEAHRGRISFTYKGQEVNISVSVK